MPSPPTVLYPPLTLPALLDRVLTCQQRPPSHITLVLCSTRHAFLERLLACLEPRHGHGHDHDQDEQHEQGRKSLEQSIMPTLRNLATARHVQVAFCPSVQALLAYLATYSGAAANEDGSHRRTGRENIVLVDPLALHASTVSYSAQGLSRTFAAAVETAARLGADLVVAECEQAPTNHSSQHEDDMDVMMGRDEEQPRTTSHANLDPWEQEVSILSASAKKFGPGHSERPWAGRTVKVKRIAARWFEFHDFDGDMHA